MAAFAPSLGVKVACTTSSGSTRVNMGAVATQVRVHNTGAVPVFLAFSPANDAVAAVPTTTAASGTAVVGAASTDVFTIAGCQYVAGITASSSADVYLNIGFGE